MNTGKKPMSVFPPTATTNGGTAIPQPPAGQPPAPAGQPASASQPKPPKKVFPLPLRGMSIPGLPGSIPAAATRASPGVYPAPSKVYPLPKNQMLKMMAASAVTSQRPVVVPSSQLPAHLQLLQMDSDLLAAASKKKRKRPKQMLADKGVQLREAAGKTWVDTSLDEWPKDDFRIFVGDLGNEVSDATLSAAFSKYSSFRMAKVIRDNRNGKTKGFGFVSLMDASEYLRALKEMDRKYVGSQPIRVKGSKWKKRQSKAFTNPMTIDKRRKKRKIKGSLKHLSGFDKSERTVKPF